MSKLFSPRFRPGSDRVSPQVLLPGAAALAAALAVYVFARANPPQLLQWLGMPAAPLDLYPGWLGSAPSLFYTLAIALFAGAFAAGAKGARRHCMAWTALALGLEASQAPGIAQTLAGWIDSALPAALVEQIAPYWINGVFDPRDLFATLLGGALAYLIISFSGKEEQDNAGN